MNGFGLELTHPTRLLLLAAAPLLVWFFVKSLVNFARWQRITSLVVRLAILLLLTLALAGLTLLHPTHEPFIVFLVDKSVSVGEDAAKASEQFLIDSGADKQRKNHLFLPFAGQPEAPTADRVSVFPVAAKTNEDSSSKVNSSVPSPATNLEAAIMSGTALVPQGFVPRLVLLSDGNQTHGDALRAALRTSAPISTVPLPARKEPEAQVSSLSLPTQVRQGEPFNVEVTIDSNHEDEALIQVYRGDHQVVSERKPLKQGANTFRFRQSIETERLANFTARISSLKSDTLLDNNTESGVIYTAGKPRVLIVESDPKLIRELVTALEGEQIQVDVRPPQGMPDNLADLQNYELLILSNVPATALTQQQMEVSRTWVQELGGGLMMLGGDQSFGLGGYYRSVLEEILPVRSDFEKEKEKPGLAMALVIDKSGSMGGDKIEMAKSAARAAVDLLGTKDQIGVIAFDGETFVISDMQSASNKGAVGDDISRIDAGGGTTMYPAMEQAFDMLRNATARLKHVIILTDGVSSPGDFTGIAQSMAQERITVSTVAIGDADSQLLEEIANTGQGRAYATDDPANIPQIFAKETVTASKSAIDEQPFVPQVIRASHAMKGIDFDNAPFLLGYVLTRPKPTCEVILATEKGDPLLVWWRYGLGFTAAFTSDAKSRWAAEWLTWPGYGQFWAQLVRHVMRKSDARGVVVQVDQKGGEATVTLDAIDPSGRFLNQAETEMTLIDPQLVTKRIPLAQSAPGRYVATLPTPLGGMHHFDIAQKKNGQLIYRQSRGLNVGYSDELRLKPTNESLLKSIAQVSGGMYEPVAADLFKPNAQTVQRPTPLWPWLVALAVILFVLDVFLRRVDLNMVRTERDAAWRKAALRPFKSAKKDTSKRRKAAASR